MTRRIALVSFLMIALFALSFSVVQAAQGNADSVITTNVETAITKVLPSDASGTSSSRITVKTTDGVVNLSGDVREAGSKKKAVEAAKKVKGVKSVVSDISVKSGS